MIHIKRYRYYMYVSSGRMIGTIWAETDDRALFFAHYKYGANKVEKEPQQEEVEEINGNYF